MDNKILMDTVSVISLVIDLIFLLFAIFLLTVKTNNRTRNWLLAFYLIVTAFDISVFFYYRYITLPPELEMLRAICFSFFKSPLLYLYVLSLIYTDFKLKLKHLIHVLPFLISVCVLIPHFFLADNSTKTYFLAHLNDIPVVKLLLTFMKALGNIYIIAIIFAIRKYKVLLLENYASNVSLSNYKWLIQLATIIITLTLITLVKDILKVTQYTEIANILTVIMLIGGLGFIFWIVLNALYYPDLFRGIDTQLQPVEKLIDHSQNSNLSTFSIEQDQKIKTLMAYMEQEEPYLEPSLTVQELAGQMKIPARDLSILINHHLNQHFFDFVNEYRINKSMKLLKDPAKTKFTILEILYEVGFNSKSSFNTAFKKYTGSTPTEYRNNSI